MCNVFQQHDKLIAPQSGHHVDIAQPGRNSCSHLLQQLVACQMAQAVVHRLKPIQVEHQQCQLFAIASFYINAVFQSLLQQPPIGQLSERIKKGQLLDLLLGSLALGDVDMGADIMGNRAVIAFHHGDDQPFGINFAILAPVPNFSLPCPGALDGFPHSGIKGRAMTPGFK